MRLLKWRLLILQLRLITKNYDQQNYKTQKLTREDNKELMKYLMNLKKMKL